MNSGTVTAYCSSHAAYMTTMCDLKFHTIDTCIIPSFIFIVIHIFLSWIRSFTVAATFLVHTVRYEGCDNNDYRDNLRPYPPTILWLHIVPPTTVAEASYYRGVERGGGVWPSPEPKKNSEQWIEQIVFLSKEPMVRRKKTLPPFNRGQSFSRGVFCSNN